MRKTMLILVLAMLPLACNAPLAAQPRTPTPFPSSPPTLTLTPTIAPITPSATVTLEVTVSPTPPGTPRPELACKVLSQSLKAGSKFAARERFDVSWQIQNAGTATWEPGVVELAYAGGPRMYQYQPVPLTHSSPPKDIIALSADMIAPRTPNVYTMFWALRRGDDYFCRMAVTIKVYLK
jgi:hypothetical protein